MTPRALSTSMGQASARDTLPLPPTAYLSTTHSSSRPPRAWSPLTCTPSWLVRKTLRFFSALIVPAAFFLPASTAGAATSWQALALLLSPPPPSPLSLAMPFASESAPLPLGSGRDGGNLGLVVLLQGAAPLLTARRMDLLTASRLTPNLMLNCQSGRNARGGAGETCPRFGDPWGVALCSPHRNNTEVRHTGSKLCTPYMMVVESKQSELSHHGTVGQRAGCLDPRL